MRATIAQREQEGQLDKLLEEAEGKSPKKLEEGPKTAPEPVPEPTPEKTPKKKVDPGDEAGGDDRMSDSSEESESENGMTPDHGYPESVGAQQPRHHECDFAVGNECWKSWRNLLVRRNVVESIGRSSKNAWTPTKLWWRKNGST